MDKEEYDIRSIQPPNVDDVAKDFSAWHILKQLVHNSLEPRPFYHKREIWWCHTGLNIGFESDGKGDKYTRPVLIIQGISLQIFIGIPITTKNKAVRHHIPIDLKDGVKRQVVISQIRSFDSKRLLKKMAVLDKDSFTKIQYAIIEMFQ